MKKAMLVLFLISITATSYAACSVDNGCYQECIKDKGASSITYCRRRCEDCWGTDAGGPSFYDYSCYQDCIQDGDTPRNCKRICK